MAGVVRLSRGRIAQKLFCSFVSQTTVRNIKLKQRICFHTSSYLNVLGQEIKMPSLSPTMTEGTIVNWLKKEGDTITPGDVLCEIQTDKAVMSFETEEEGILAKILVDSGTKDIKVGSLIALMVAEGEDWKAVEIPGIASPPGIPGKGGSAPSSVGGNSSSSYSGGGSVPGLEVKMPSLSPTMSEGTIVAWKKKEGDKINPGDALCEIQTDKAIMTFEVEEEGVLAKILVPQGTTNIQVGTLIALIVEPDANWKDVRIPGAEVPVADVPVADHSARVAVASPSFVTGSVPGQEINMPSLSPTMSEGTIISWKKNEGDKINPGDALCEIQTDKAIMTFEVEEEGILAKILVPAGTANVKVGTLIALMVEEGTDWQDVKIPGDVSIAAKPVSVSAPAPTFTTGSVPGLEVKMPSLSPTMSEGVIVSWVKKEGEKINPGDVLCEIQTDKAVMSFETEEEGVLAKILAPANSGPVKVGSLIAMIVDEGKDWKDVAIPVIGAPAAAPTAAPAPAPAVPKPQPVPSGFHVVGDFAPAVRTLLERYHLTGKEVTPTGRNKRLLKGDVLKYVADNKLSPKPPEPVPLPVKKAPAAKPPTPVSKPPEPGRKVGTNYTDIEVSSMRRTIANRLTQSKTEIPHAYSTLEAQIDGLLSARKQLQNLGVKVSVNDFVVKAVASALKQCPFINVLYAQDQIKPSSTIDISIAVATPNGLITPIVKSADKKSIDEISLEIQKLAEKARLGKLQLNEFQGGSFTISNLGMFGIREFSAIINPPQCAILAVGGGQLTIKPDGSKATMMSATLSYDARAMMEDEVALFMEILEGYLENPASLLLTGATIKVKSKATYEL
ncbi:uncharacterized protein LOC142332015 [Lycorma delicatula]|uniref:uncharacterized protein LOC142332015 n=1 Tax=Lycorma delicatula TaxID=130591 RepID=UPI003F51137D